MITEPPAQCRDRLLAACLGNNTGESVGGGEGGARTLESCHKSHKSQKQVCYLVPACRIGISGVERSD